ncbi:MAG: hypothetical protein HZB80_03215 [Deltaproteobacteria bacterium]|nr:hypothetical protein [Deltaproteobacteria bacterium]
MTGILFAVCLLEHTIITSEHILSEINRSKNEASFFDKRNPLIKTFRGRLWLACALHADRLFLKRPWGA